MVTQLLRVAVATAVMTGCVLAFELLWAAPGVEHRLLLGVWVAVVVIVASLAYVLASRLLRIQELSELVRAFKGRSRPAAESGSE